MDIPATSLTKSEILSKLTEYKSKDLPWRSGRVLAYTYDPGREVEEITKSAYMSYLCENALDPTSFPSVVRLEREVVRMIATLLRGDDKVVGNFTSGGTESLLLAVKTARDKARVERPEITRPEMVMPRTAHSAFHKAAAYFDVKPVLVPFDASTFKVDLAAMRKAINPNTILLVGSAPGYAHGVIDPIREIGQLALENKLLFHVDGCVGGIHLSFMRLLGMPVTDFDFSVPGVTSISADMHKYGYSAKGASVVLYRDKSIRKHQLFACAASTTYALINATILSSKSGGPSAGAWAILHYLGENGYKQIVRDVQTATGRLINEINAIDGLRVLGEPVMCMFAIASDEFNVFDLQDEMVQRGWYLQPQFSTETSPSNLHITVNVNTLSVIDEFLQALRDGVEAVRKMPNPTRRADLEAAIAPLLANPSSDLPAQLAAMGGLDGSGLPERMALVNTVLDILPDHITEAMLIEFVNDLYV
jgi:sphinganine-1-phosphate aldolase